MTETDPALATSDESASVRWGLGDAAAGWLLGILGGTVTGTIVLALSGSQSDDFADLSLGWIALAQLGLWFGLLGVPLVASRLKGNGAVRDFGLRLTRGDLGVGALCGIAAQYAIVWIVYLPIQLLTDVSSSEISEPAREMSDRATDPVGVLLLVLIVGIGAPIVEEVFYRGLLQRSLARRFGPVWAVAGSSLAFGVSHFELLQLPALVLFGVVLGVLAERYGRLGPSIVAHVLFNMTAVVSLLSA